MPLHVGENHDRGGNSLQVRWFDQGSNLHRVWDSGIIDKADRGEDGWLADLVAMDNDQARADAQKGSVEDWATESLLVSRAAYVDPSTGQRLKPGAKLGDVYQQRSLPVVKDRLYRAGARLAMVLNEALGPEGDATSSTPVKEPELRLELLRRVKADQDARFALIEWQKQRDADRKAEREKLAEAVKKADTENTARLGEIVERYGWPSIALVGKDGSHAAWLLVQHSDADPKFQRKCLDLMAKLPKSEVSQMDLAYLTDRVLLAEGKEQVYGTQFTVSGGKWEPRPLMDPANVDKRRAEVGLPPLAEYVKDLQALYGRPPQR
jgi:hypothetical protein